MMMPQNKDESKTIKEILSTDYHIAGIRPYFYLPVLIVSFAVAFYLSSNITPPALLFFIAFVAFIIISMISALLGKVIRRLR
jgi:hypothetical protein